MAELVQYMATGRRKTAVARVILRPGEGKIVVNHQAFNTYFPSEALRAEVQFPLVHTELAGKFDILVNAAGRRNPRPGRRRSAWHRARPGDVQRRTPVAFASRRLPDARPAGQGTEEVRPKGSAQAVPVLETVGKEGVRCRVSGVRKPDILSLIRALENRRVSCMC